MLGDLTDAKDNHSAELTNKVVKAINGLPIDDIKILAGNHDWLKQGHEYFKFLNLIPAVTFITEPCEDEDNIQAGRKSAYYLPYSKNPVSDWKGRDFSHYDYLFLHQTIKGARASNGQEMEGEELPELNALRVMSGDIHVPQDIGNLTYVGSPYHVHFGDNFKPRCILIDKQGRETDLHFETIKRVVVKVSSLRQLKRMEFREGDQIKLRVELDESDKHGWSKMRREAVAILNDHGVEIHGVELNVVKSTRRVIVGGNEGQAVLTPQESILHYVEREELGGSAFESAIEVIES